jgi:peptidoglycan/xylan/chitin deacetylase (PgdA/CDA1 family)
MSKNKLSPVLKMGRWIRSRFVNAGLILLYHRVSDPETIHEPDPYSLCVTPNHFADQMKWLREFTNPISLQAMVAGLQGSRLPPRAIAVTFDDGYADNLYQAKPILEEYKVPATVFVISGSIGGAFWWDQIARIILLPEQLPNYLSINLGARSFQAPIESSKIQTRNRLLKKVHSFMRDLQPEERNAAITQLSSWADIRNSSSEITRPMTMDEVQKLAQDGLVEIGSHTTTHPSLSIMNISQQEEEIQRSKIDLEQVTGRPVNGFSYPYGLERDYSSATVKVLQGSGIKYACTNKIDAIGSHSDLYQLPRYWIKDISSEKFGPIVNRWLSN